MSEFKESVEIYTNTLKSVALQSFENIYKDLQSLKVQKESEIQHEMLLNYVRCAILAWGGKSDDKRSA